MFNILNLQCNIDNKCTIPNLFWNWKYFSNYVLLTAIILEYPHSDCTIWPRLKTEHPHTSSPSPKPCHSAQNPVTVLMLTGAELLDVLETRGSSRSVMKHQPVGESPGRAQWSVVIVCGHRNGPLRDEDDDWTGTEYFSLIYLNNIEKSVHTKQWRNYVLTYRVACQNVNHQVTAKLQQCNAYQWWACS